MEVRGRGAESKVEFIWILTQVFPLWIKKLEISQKPGKALRGSSWLCSHGRREGKDHTFEIAFLYGWELWVAVTDLMLPPASVHFIILSLISSRCKLFIVLVIGTEFLTYCDFHTRHSVFYVSVNLNMWPEGKSGNTSFWPMFTWRNRF